jgi:hypothetical protein
LLSSLFGGGSMNRVIQLNYTKMAGLKAKAKEQANINHFALNFPVIHHVFGERP